MSSIKINTLKNKINEILTNKFSKEDSELITEYFLWAEMTGCKTQGIIKMAGKEPIQNIVPKGKITVTRETKLSKLLDAKSNPAILATQLATNDIIKGVSENGFYMIGINNTFSSNGSQAFYVNKIAEAGYIGFICSRSPSSTTAYNSIDALFGTNPIGIAIPTTNAPLVFDMATSAYTYYGLILANLKGEKIPDNVAIDSEGNLTNDPSEAMNGAILPFDRSYKSSGISTFVEILAGPLVGGGWVDNKDFNQSWGTLLIGIDPNLLVDAEEFKANATDLISKIKSSRKQNNTQEIRLPGERARKSFEQALEIGEVEVDEKVLEAIGL